MSERHRIEIPDGLAEMMADIIAGYRAESVIDPYCDDLAVLRRCTAATSMRAIFPNPKSMREAESGDLFIDTEVGDITKVSLDAVFDAVTTLVPFGVRVREEGTTRLLDLVVAERCLDIVAPNGVCLLVVPSAFLTAWSYRSFRQRVLDSMALDASVELPSKTFGRTSHIAAALLVVRNGPRRHEGTFMGKYSAGIEPELVASIQNRSGQFMVANEALDRRWDRHFHDPAHARIESKLDGFETITLGDAAEIRMGHPRLREYFAESGDYLVISPRHVHDKKFEASERDKFVDEIQEPWFENLVIRPGDVLINSIQPTAYVYQASDPPAVAGMNVVHMRPHDSSRYIATYLNTPDGRKLFQAQADRHATRLSSIQRIAVSQLRDFRIPRLPVEDLDSVSDEAIEEADAPELDRLRTELLRVRHQLEVTEGELERVRSTDRSEFEALVESQLAKVIEQQLAMNARVDQLFHVLSGMRQGIDSIKEGSRDEEEKLARICDQLDEWASHATTHSGSVASYVSAVQVWLDNWDELDPLTQKFLPSAEHLYDALEKDADAEFSPFVVQYCRSLENEILVKLFQAYHDDFGPRIGDPESFLADDLDNEKTKRFAKTLIADNRKHTLGDMIWTMQLLKPSGNTFAASELLRDFRAFAVRCFDERVVEKEFVGLLRQINEELRVKAAHPYAMGKALADKCVKLVRPALSDLLDAYHPPLPD